jgi:hypothetical protein
LAPISAWLLVYLSIQKFISIKVTIGESKENFQKLIIFLILLYNLVYYSPILLLVHLVNQPGNNALDLNSTFYSNDTNQTASTKYECNFSILYQENTYSWMDLLNLTILPFSLMISFSLILLHTIFHSSTRISRINTVQDRNRLKKNIKFGISSILLNLFFVILHLPICIANFFFEFFHNYYDLILSIYYSSYCINFYILFIFNSIFRKEVLLLFKSGKK